MKKGVSVAPTDTQVQLYHFPEGYQPRFNDAFFHHESDTAPVAFDSETPSTMAPSRACSAWQVGSPLVADSTQAQYRSQWPASANLRISCAGATAFAQADPARAKRVQAAPRTAIVPIDPQDLEPLA